MIWFPGKLRKECGIGQPRGTSKVCSPLTASHVRCKAFSRGAILVEATVYVLQFPPRSKSNVIPKRLREPPLDAKRDLTVTEPGDLGVLEVLSIRN